MSLPNLLQSPNRSEAKSFVSYIGDGATNEYSFNFEYLRREFIKVEIDGVRVLSFIFKDASTILLQSPVAEGAVLTIKRITDSSRIVTFIDGSILKSTDLNISAIQTVHIAEEGRDYMTNTVGVDDEGNIDARFKRVVRVKNAVADDDAVNKRYVDSEGQFAISNTYASAQAAKASEVASKDSETKAKASEVAAKDSENTVVPLVPVVDQASKDAAKSALMADESSKRAEQAVVDIKNLGAIPIGTIVAFTLDVPLPAGYLPTDASRFDPDTYLDLANHLNSDILPYVPDTITITHGIKAAGILANEGVAQLDGVMQRLDATESRTGSSGALSWRNRIINGAFQVNQRGLTFDASIAVYTSDRWKVNASHAVSANVNERYLMVQGTAWPSLLQRIESVNIKDLTGKPITLSFKARITENLGAADVYIEVRKPVNAADSWSGNEPTIVSLNLGKLTGTFQRISRTFSCDTTLGIEVKVVAILPSGAPITLDVGEVQLEEGIVATPFEHRPYGVELALCQRYYRTGRITFLQHTTSVQAVGATVDGFVPMRVLPTLTWKQTYSNNAAFTYFGIQAPVTDLIRLIYTGVVGGAMDIDGIYTADAEL